MTDVWIGLAFGTPADPDDDDIGGAFVHVLAPADDLREFRAAAEEALIERGFRLVSLEDAEAVRERLASDSIHPDLLELAIDAALERETQLGDFFTYPTEDGEEPETADLHALVESGELVNVQGHGEQHDTIGFVVGVGAEWALIRLVSPYGTEDGFRAVRLGTVAEIEQVDSDSSFLPRLMASRPLPPGLPAVALDDTRGLLESTQRLCELVYLVTDEMEPGAFWIGRISALDGDGALLRKVSQLGTWIDEEHFPYDAITRVGFGGDYERALAAAAESSE
jgi:hypothetical protein